MCRARCAGTLSVTYLIALLLILILWRNHMDVQTILAQIADIKTAPIYIVDTPSRRM